MIENPYEIIRNEIMRKYTFDMKDVLKPLSDTNPFKPDKIRKDINVKVQIKIEDIRDEGLTDKEICLGCVSEVFQNVLTAPEKEVPELKKKCVFKRYKTIENLFKKQDSKRSDFYPKTKDILAIYCGYLGWNDLDINNDFTHKERKEIPELESKNYFKKLEHLIESLEEYKSEVEKNTPNQNTDVVLQEIQKLKSDFQSVSKKLEDSLTSKKDLQEATERIEKILDSTLKTLPVNNQNYNTYNTQINIAVEELKVFLKTIIKEKKSQREETRDSLPFIKAPNIFKAFFERILINSFNQKSRLFNFDNKIVPIGFERNLLKSKTENYIDTNYQNGIIYNPQDGALNQKEIFKTLFKKIFKNNEEPVRDTKWIFILAGSGIGKTSLLIRLYLETHKFGKFKNRVYFLPFSQRHKIQYLKREDKLGSILFLDAFDEDFSMSKISRLTIEDITKLRALTQPFQKVVLTSRSQFFEDKFKIDNYVKNLGTEIDFKYETFVLCPFTQEQINKYIKRKFKGNKVKIEKAKRVIEYIGEDTNRQLLISQVDLLIDLLDEKDIPTEIKEYHIFDTMLTNWLVDYEKTKIKDSNLKNKENRLKAFEKENTYIFCRILAKYFYKEERDFYIGFSIKELKKELDENKVEHSSLKINRTFLVLTKEGNYRFAHRSIYEFFLAEYFFENEKPIKIKEDKENLSDFARRIYTQKLYFLVNEIVDKLLEEELQCDVQFTTKQRDIDQYALDIRFEPYFLIEKDNKGEDKQIPFFKREWTYFSELKKDITICKKIIGLKIICEDDFYSEEVRKQKRQKCIDIISSLFLKLPKIGHYDMSEIIIDKDRLIYGNGTSILNKRADENILSLNLFNPFSKSSFYGTINLRGSNVASVKANNIILNYSKKGVKLSKNLFSLILESEIKIEKTLYIFLSHEDLEKGKEHLLDVDRIRVLSKVKGFECVFFTEDKVLEEAEILKCFPDVHKTKLNTTNIEYFKKAGNYVDFFDEKNCIIRKGYNKVFTDTVFNNYPNDFPTIKKEELELEVFIGSSDKQVLKVLKNIEVNSVYDFSMGHLQVKFHNEREGRMFFLHMPKEVTYNGYLYDDLFLKQYEKILLNYFANFNHFVLDAFNNRSEIMLKIVKKIKELELKSLFITDIKSAISLKNIINSEFTKRLGLNFNLSQESDIDFENLLNYENIEELTIISSNDKLNIKNVLMAFQVNSIKILTLNAVFVSDFELLKGVVNTSIFSLTVHYQILIDVISENIVFKELVFLEIKGIDLNKNYIEFIKFLKRLLLDSKLKELVFNFSFPKNDEEIGRITKTIDFLAELKIEKISIVFTNIKFLNSELNHRNTFIYNSILNHLKKTAFCSFFFLGLNVSRFNINKSLEGKDEILYFDLSNIHLSEIRIFIKNNSIVRFREKYPLFFYQFIDILISKKEIKKMKIDDDLIEIENDETKALNLFKENFTQIKDDFFYLNFLDSEFKTLLNNTEFFSLKLFEYVHIRFINIGLKNYSFLYNSNFTHFYKFSFSSIDGIDFEKDFSNQIEVELLTYYMPLKEKEKISEYKTKFKELGIKLIINPSELKVINADKGLFETQVVFNE